METEEKIETTPEVVPAPAPEPAPTSDARKRLDAARLFAAEQYEKVRSATAEQYEKVRSATAEQFDNVRTYTAGARRQLNEGWDETYKKAQELHKAGEEYVKANPTGSVLGALGVGLIVGLLLRGGRH